MEIFLKMVNTTDISILKERWKVISSIMGLTEDFIRNNKDTVQWDTISMHQKLSEAFIAEFLDRVNWDYISEYQTLSEDFILTFKDLVNWDYITIYQKLGEKFIEYMEYIEDYHINFELLPTEEIDTFSDKFFRKNFHKMDTTNVIENCYRDIPLDLIKSTEEAYPDVLDWDVLSCCRRIHFTDSFISEYKDYINWRGLCRTHKLSDSIIMKYSDKVDWKEISIHYVLSNDFVNKNKDKICFSRPNIIYSRDIEPYLDKYYYNAISKIYLSLWDKDQEITWNELLSAYPDDCDYIISFIAANQKNKQLIRSNKGEYNKC